MCWPGLPGKGLARPCCQQKCSRRCLWRGAGALEGAQDHPSLPGTATGHQHWACLSPLALAQLCAPQICVQDGAGHGWTWGRHSRNVPGAAHTWGNHRMPWVHGAAPLEPPPCCFPTRWEPNNSQGWAHWRAWGKVCKEKPQGWKELLSNTSGMGSAPGIQVWEQLQSRSYSLTSTPAQARKRGTVL